MSSTLGLLRLMMVLALIASPAQPWRHDRRPKVYGWRLSGRVLSPWHRKVQRKILQYHNFFRSHVKPHAKDMLLMRWDKGASWAAQRWADSCSLLNHDTVKGRWFPRFGPCGQNIFISTQRVPWYFAIKTWYLERHNFTYGATDNDLETVGHYTQMVWSATHRLGCGFTKCPKHFAYVCNYCPIGNHLERLGQPYEKGPPCEACPSSCGRRGLCSNSCPTADLWANCKQIAALWPDWLCSSRTEKGVLRKENCRATCTCQGKIY